MIHGPHIEIVFSYSCIRLMSEKERTTFAKYSGKWVIEFYYIIQFYH